MKYIVQFNGLYVSTNDEVRRESKKLTEKNNINSDIVMLKFQKIFKSIVIRIF